MDPGSGGWTQNPLLSHAVITSEGRAVDRYRFTCGRTLLPGKAYDPRGHASDGVRQNSCASGVRVFAGSMRALNARRRILAPLDEPCPSRERQRLGRGGGGWQSLALQAGLQATERGSGGG